MLLRACIGVALLLPIFWAESALAAEPSLTIKLVLVRETDACRPAGYSSDEREQNCEKWTADEAAEMFRLRPTKIVRDVPPGDIDIGKKLQSALERYAWRLCPQNACTDAAARRSILLIFEWSEPQTGKVKLSRRQRNNRNFSIKEAVWERNLEDESRWVNHQRADGFFPPYHVEWALETPNGSWLLRAVSPR